MTMECIGYFYLTEDEKPVQHVKESFSRRIFKKIGLAVYNVYDKIKTEIAKIDAEMAEAECYRVCDVISEEDNNLFEVFLHDPGMNLIEALKQPFVLKNTIVIGVQGTIFSVVSTLALIGAIILFG